MTSPMTLPAALAAACYATSLALMAWLHLRFPAHDLWRDPVSDYGAVSASRPWFQANGVVGGVGGLLLAWALAQAGLPDWIVGCLAASVLARGLVAVFPTDLEGAPRTRAGRLHLLCAVASFALVYTVIDNATPPLAAALDGGWATALGALRWVCAAGLTALVACLVLRPLRGGFGLAERVFLIGVPLWFLCASLALALR